MMRTSVGTRLAMTIAALTTFGVVAPADSIAAQYPSDQSAPQAQELFTVDELDNLLAPIALYPDPILAQVFVAATYPEQIALAARYVRLYGDRDIDNQGWDGSVKAVARYLPVLNMLAEREDWTVALGQAYVLQPGDVMASVQGLRQMAYDQGNLVSTAEQRIEYAPRAIRIVPAQARVIYVPTYDPTYIYFQPVHYARARSSYWSFGIALPIGVWLNYDVDWGHHNVYYHGWEGYAGSDYNWYHVSRPFITFNTVYVHPHRTVVVINRKVVHRHVNYVYFDDYRTVHRQVAWDRRDLPGRGNGARDQRPGGWNDDPRGGERRGGRGDDGRRVADETRAPRNAPDNTNRVTPTRIGGNNRPLYPPTGGNEGGRTAQPRSAPENNPSRTSASQNTSQNTPQNTPLRTPQRASPSRGAAPATAPGAAWPGNTRQLPAKVPKADPYRTQTRSNPTRATPVAPRSPSAPQRGAAPSQATPREPQAAPDRTRARSQPSAPRASSPAPRASSPAPRASSPAPRASSSPSRPARSAPDKPAKPSGREKPGA